MHLAHHGYQMVCSSPGHFHVFLFFFKSCSCMVWVLQLILGFWTGSSNTIFNLFQVSYLHYLPCFPVETEFPCCSGVMWKDDLRTSWAESCMEGGWRAWQVEAPACPVMKCDDRCKDCLSLSRYLKNTLFCTHRKSCKGTEVFQWSLVFGQVAEG